MDNGVCKRCRIADFFRCASPTPKNKKGLRETLYFYTKKKKKRKINRRIQVYNKMEIRRSYFIPGPLLTHLTLSMWKLFPLRVVPFFSIYTTPMIIHIICLSVLLKYIYKKGGGRISCIWNCSWTKLSEQQLDRKKEKILSPGPSTHPASDIVDIETRQQLIFNCHLQ